jgi:beta-apo-4'-carotenal oxygenase
MADKTKVAIPAYEATAVDAIPAIARTVRQTFRTNKTKDIEWRLVQLRKLYWSLTDLSTQIQDALEKDLRKCRFESTLTEVEWLKNDCMFMITHLKTFAKDEKLGSPDVPLSYSMMNVRIRKEPMGAVLIIGPYNYPIHLLLAPLVGAIAAGCTAVLKPSEMAPASAMVCIEILKALDTNAFAVVNGAVAETTALLEEKWDKILYTGGAQVGTIIAKKAAETLTPVCLELGGKNPAFVTKNANLALAARRLLWSKTLNAGQVCMSQNYVLVEKSVVPTFIEHLNASFKEFFPNGAKASPDLSRIINQRHFLRMKKMVDDTKGKIVMGGQMDESDLFIEPTAVLVNSMDDSMVVEESFGPIFSIYPVNTLDEALNIANAVHKTPLTLFAFGSKAENKRSRSFLIYIYTTSSPLPSLLTLFVSSHKLTSSCSPQRDDLRRCDSERLLPPRLDQLGPLRRRRRLRLGRLPRQGQFRCVDPRPHRRRDALVDGALHPRPLHAIRLGRAALPAAPDRREAKLRPPRQGHRRRDHLLGRSDAGPRR